MNIPTGWKLVPVEPTEAMRQAAWGVFDHIGDIKKAWAAMLATSPAPPDEGGGWRPIAEAPKDGSPVLACNIDSFGVSTPRIYYWCSYSPECSEVGVKWRTAKAGGDAANLTHYLATFRMPTTTRPNTETCESAQPECGPVTNHDSHGVPLCAVCWDGLLKDSAKDGGA